MRMREHERARHHFERAAELRPTSYEDRLQLAQSLYETGWTDRAQDLGNCAQIVVRCSKDHRIEVAEWSGWPFHGQQSFRCPLPLQRDLRVI